MTTGIGLHQSPQSAVRKHALDGTFHERIGGEIFEVGLDGFTTLIGNFIEKGALIGGELVEGDHGSIRCRDDHEFSLRDLVEQYAG